MPIYEYECTTCGNRFEVIQGYSDAPITNCNTCSGKVRKVISSPAIVFKGSGWYVSDYSEKFKDKNKVDVKKPSPEVKTEVHTDAKGNTNSEANTSGGAGGTEKPAETKQASPSSQPDK